MRKQLLIKLFALAVIVGIGFTACKDYDDDISRLDKELTAVKSDVTTKIDAAKNEMQTAINNAISQANTKITALEAQVAKLKEDVAKAATKAELEAAKAELERVKQDLANNYVTKTVLEQFKTETTTTLNALSAKVTALETNSATKAELTAAKTALEASIAALQADLNDLKAKAATKVELDAAVKALEAKIQQEKEALLVVTDALDGRIKTLEDNTYTKLEVDAKLLALKQELEGTIKTLENTLTALIGDLRSDLTALSNAFNGLKTSYDAFIDGKTDYNVTKILSQITTEVSGLKSELDPRIKVLEGLLAIAKDEEGAYFSATLDDIKKKIQVNTDSIDNLRADMLGKYGELLAADTELRRLININAEGISTNATNIAANTKAIADINTYIEKTLKPQLTKIQDDIKGLDTRLGAAEEAIQLNLRNIFVLSKQLRGLTFVPTRGMPAEKTMKLYYFAGDYTAEHVFIYRVTPSNSVLGTDFNIESLNYQITTRSANDGVDDASEQVDVIINPEGVYEAAGQQGLQIGIKQFGDLLYVPVKIQASACDVFGNLDWWSNTFYGGVTALDQSNFPANIVKTVKDPKVDYENPTRIPTHTQGLSLVITATTNNLEGGEPEVITFKSTEHVNTFLVPTQIKLSEAKDGKGNQILDSNLTQRLLNTTLKGATDWANKNENTLPNDDKNWNILAWSGNQGEGGVWTPGKIDLNDYVNSLYYPQDGGDLSRKNTVDGDPHRYLYAEFGKEFGTPYFDKPHYAKPVYKFEQMVYKDANHNIVSGPEGGEGVDQHFYATIEDGHILTVINDGNKITGIRNKKLIIKVTQINSECAERQPVGYLVIKYTDSPQGLWPDVNHTIDLNGLPYYHQDCETANVADTEANKLKSRKLITKTYQDLNDPNATFNRKNALLEPFTEDKIMNAINGPGSYGLAGAQGVDNPGDVIAILGEIPQLNGIGEGNMGNIYNIQRRDASVVPGSPKFIAAGNNHVNDKENVAATGVTAEQAFRHVMIRYEYGNHAYVVYVDDFAPAGEYEITYKLENKENNTQHGNVLYLTFKFKVALRDITVAHDAKKINWLNNNTLRVQHTRIHNSIGGVGHSKFKSDEGYIVDLREAFVLNSGSIDMTTTTLPAIGGVNAGAAPGYRPKFEFIQLKAIKDAGFTYKRDADNYLTEIWLGTQLAAKIDNSPADGFNNLYIKFNRAGDMLYNYLMGNMKEKMDIANHNTLTKWGKTELTDVDDMERLLPVRMVTDINAKCLSRANDRFPNGNYYYIEDFNIKFERALRFAFTTVELKDDQQFQLAHFDFMTKDVDPQDESKSVYRGLFDHAYYGADAPAGHVDHGYGNLVITETAWWLWTPYTFTNPRAQGEFYGVNDGTPLFLKKLHEPHTLPLAANQLIIPEHPDWIPVVQLTYTGLSYDFVEISEDGGETWKKAPQDYFVLDHNNRYFNVITVPYQVPFSSEYFERTVAIWQGNTKGLQSPLYFRVPVTNINGWDIYGPDEVCMTFRSGYAKVKGYAVFKINPRNK